MNHGLGARLGHAASYGFLLVLLVVVLFPFYWMTVTALKSEEQMRSLASMFWPDPVVWDNFRHLLAQTDFVAWFKNSVLVAVASTFASELERTWAGSRFARRAARSRSSPRRPITPKPAGWPGNSSTP